MKTSTLKNIEEKFGDNSLQLRSGLSAENSQNENKHLIKNNKSFDSFSITATLSKMKSFYTTPATSNCQNKGGFTYKNSFMKTFLQKTGAIAFTLLLVNLFFINSAAGQSQT